jgi:hypothetical protein
MDTLSAWPHGTLNGNLKKKHIRIKTYGTYRAGALSAWQWRTERKSKKNISE